jgi:serine/threonine protein kinase
MGISMTAKRHPFSTALGLFFQFHNAQKVALRDLKLQNILTTTFPSVKLPDFGPAVTTGLVT